MFLSLKFAVINKTNSRQTIGHSINGNQLLLRDTKILLTLQTHYRETPPRLDRSKTFHSPTQSALACQAEQQRVNEIDDWLVGSAVLRGA